MQKIISTLVIIFGFHFSLFSQNETDSLSNWQKHPNINISGFAEIYYVFDINQPQNSQRQSFLFNHNRHNEFNLNLGFIKLNLDHLKYRANFALHSGTYVMDNYIAEPTEMKNIFEANIGLSLNKTNSVWIDAGIFPSHIGFESAVSTDNWTMTRSLLAENSPYFLSGLKLTHKPNNHIEIAGLILNGWQRIKRLSGNSIPSWGTQLKLTPKEDITLNWSTFIGTDSPDSIRKMRYFNNLFGQFQITKKIGLIAGFDFGVQQKTKHSAKYDFWYSPVFITQYSINKKWKSAIRFEYYHDESGVIISNNSPNGFKTKGVSWNFDFLPNTFIMCRFEGRWFNSSEKIFTTNKSISNYNVFWGASMSMKFSELLTK